jgi:hypothetical protein
MNRHRPVWRLRTEVFQSRAIDAVVRRQPVLMALQRPLQLLEAVRVVATPEQVSGQLVEPGGGHRVPLGYRLILEVDELPVHRPLVALRALVPLKQLDRAGEHDNQGQACSDVPQPLPATGPGQGAVAPGGENSDEGVVLQLEAFDAPPLSSLQDVDPPQPAQLRMYETWIQAGVHGQIRRRVRVLQTTGGGQLLQQEGGEQLPGDPPGHHLGHVARQDLGHPSPPLVPRHGQLTCRARRALPQAAAHQLQERQRHPQRPGPVRPFVFHQLA